MEIFIFEEWKKNKKRNEARIFYCCWLAASYMRQQNEKTSVHRATAHETSTTKNIYIKMVFIEGKKQNRESE